MRTPREGLRARPRPAELVVVRSVMSSPRIRRPLAARPVSVRLLALALALGLGGCACGPQDGGTNGPNGPNGPSSASDSTDGATATGDESGATASSATTASGDSMVADVLGVTVTGEPGDYTFAVTVKSPDTGCERYADWWEVVTPDGLLLYRRILAHSHVDEQPFTRTGGPVPIDAGDVVVVRAHLAPGGYGGQVLRGAPSGEFAPAPELQEGFALSLESSPPLPDVCQF